MSSTPVPTNTTAQSIDNAEASAISAVVSAAETLAIASVPALGYPVLKQLWEGLANYFAGLFSKVAQTGTTFLVVDSQTSSEQSNLSAALKALIAAEQSGNANAIQQALQVYAKAQSSLVKDDGSTPSTQ